MICCQQLRNTLNQIFHEENSSDLYPQFCGTTGLYFVLGLVIFCAQNTGYEFWFSLVFEASIFRNESENADDVCLKKIKRNYRIPDEVSEK